MSTPADSSPAAVDRENPWPGLGSYDESMHGYFFGRDTEVDELLRLVRRDPVALFYGQSGLGKSSLLQAGLFPKLRAADMLPVHIRLRFGAEFPQPTVQILEEVAAAARRGGGEAPKAPAGTTLFDYFYDEAHEFWSARNRVLVPVIVFDQFEEIFTLGARDSVCAGQRDELLAQLADLAARRAPAALVARFEHDPGLAARYSVDRTRCRLLFSMREDFLPELGSLRDHLPTLPTGGLRLQRLRGHQAREVLEKPGAHLLEPETTERIIRFVAAERTSGETHELSELEVEPALLNVVARELNTRRLSRGLDRISADLVQGARNEILGDFYERAFAGMEPHVRAFVEDQLLTTTGFRDSVAVEDAEASYRIPRDILARLVDRRLLRIDERFQMQRVELTHDLLAGVVKISRDSRREREAVAEERRRAAEARRIAEAATAEAQSKLRHTRARALIGAVILLLAVGIGGLSYLNQRKGAEARRLDAERQAAIEARQAADAAREEARASLQRANEAIADSLLLQADAALANGSFDSAQLLLRMGEDHGVFPGGVPSVFAAALNQPRILQLESILRFGDIPRQVEFAPGGRLLAISSDQRIRLITVPAASASTALLPLEEPPGDLAAIEHASHVDLLWGEPTLLAVATDRGALSIHDLATGRTIRTLEPHPSQKETTAILRVAFSADGRSLAAIAATGSVTAWRVPGVPAWSDSAITPDVFIHNVTLEITAAKPEARLAWAADGSLGISDADSFRWLTPPGPAWAADKIIERINLDGLVFAVRPGADLRNSDWLASPQAENRIHWLAMPSFSAAGSEALDSRGSESLPDTVHDIAALPGSDSVFIALRNGTIATYRTARIFVKTTFRPLQTVVAPRARHLTLRLRPAGDYLGAFADDGTAYLYRIQLPTSLADQGTPPSSITRSADGTWTLPSPAVSAGELLATHHPVDGAPVTFGVLFDNEPPGVLSLGTHKWIWQRSVPDLGFSSSSPILCAAFSADGARLALGAEGTLSIVHTADGAPAREPLPLSGQPQRLAWSADGLRLAVATSLQEITIFHLDDPTASPTVIHARSSRLDTLALDPTGTTLAYSTPDARLALERLIPQDRRSSLMLTLSAPASALALGNTPASTEIAAAIQESARVYTGSLPTSAELEWTNAAVIDGYSAIPRTTTGSQLTRLEAAAWLDTDRTIQTTAASRMALIWAAEVRAALEASGELYEPAALDALLTQGRALRKLFKPLAANSPVIAAMHEALTEPLLDVENLAHVFEPSDTPGYRRWPLILDTKPFDGGRYFAVQIAFPSVIDHLNNRKDDAPPLSKPLRAAMVTIAALAASDAEASEKFAKHADLLRTKLFTEGEWLAVLKTCPDVDLLDREAARLANSGNMESSDELYLALEHNHPERLEYAIRRGNNLYRRKRYDEAMALFNQTAEAARKAGNGELLGEALIYRARTLAALDRLPEAIDDAVAGAEAASTDAWTQRNAIILLTQCEAHARAVDAARRLVEIADTVDNRVHQARVYLGIGDETAARETLITARNATTDAEQWITLGELLLGGITEASKSQGANWLYEAYRETKDHAVEERALRLLGPVCFAIEKHVAAHWAYTTLKSKYTLTLEDQAAVHAGMGRADLLLSRLPAARENLETALRVERVKRPDTLRLYATLLEREGDRAGALTHYRQAATGNDPGMLLALALACRRLGQPEEARKALQRGLAAHPDDRDLRLLQARTLLATDQAAALKLLEGLDDGSGSRVALHAMALRGRAAEAATIYIAQNDAYPTDFAEAASIVLLAARQTGDTSLRATALLYLSAGAERGYRVDTSLLQSPSLEAFADDPEMRLFAEALALPFEDKAALLAIARFNLRGAGMQATAEQKETMTTRARTAIDRAVELGLLSREKDILTDPELAPLAAQP